MSWSRTLSPDQAPPWPQHPVVEVDEALLTPFARGPLRTDHPTDHGPSRWVTGAVHTATGALVVESQKQWQGTKLGPVSADPEVVLVPEDAERLAGGWQYAGHWSGHFGHFLLEVLPTLWPDPAQHHDRVGLVAHRPPRGDVPPVDVQVPLETPELPPWQRGLLELAGYGDHQLRIVHGRALRVERLSVPVRPVLLRRWAQPAAVDIWRRISDAVADRGEHPRVYLSRTLFHAHAEGADRARTDGDWDRTLDQTFAEAGFAVVHPETLTITEQIALVRGADVLAGQSGSALHLSAFARSGTRVLTMGDSRSKRGPTPGQSMLDSACGHRSAFVADRDHAGLLEVLVSLRD